MTPRHSRSRSTATTAKSAAARRRRRRQRRLRVAIVVAIAALLCVAGAALVFILSAAAGGKLEITEYMSNNDAYPDEDGQLFDWIELYNGGLTSLNLAGYTLSDGTNTHTFGEVKVPGRGYAVIYCVGVELKDQAQANPYWAPIGLTSQGGETITLKDPKGKVVEQFTTIALASNQSAVKQDGRFVPGDLVTPGYANTPKGRENFDKVREVQDGGLVISEVMASNGLTVPDEDGYYFDYIEVQNTGDKEISLKGYGLSNNPNKPLKFQFPDMKLKPGEVALVFAAGKEYTGGKPMHADFKVNKTADTIYLSNPKGVVIDQVHIQNLLGDTALVRTAQGTFAVADSPSPGHPNTPDGVQAFLTAQAATREPDLIISEAISRNTSSVPLGGKYYDWIELYNPTDKPISLKGYHLTDDMNQPQMFPLPDKTLAPGQYLLVYACGGKVSNSSAIQANFKLDGTDDIVALIRPDGKLADGLVLNQVPTNISKGRMPGQVQPVYFAQPTPGEANRDGKPRITPMPAVSQPGGVYDNITALEVALTGEGTIYYTTDGSKPTTSSQRYTGPLSLTKTTVIRAIAVADGATPSPVLTASYIINEQHTVDVVSLVSDPYGFFSQEYGIYADGPNPGTQFPYSGANYWKDWEREAHASLFSKGETVFEIDCGVKIFGSYSRAYEKKSLSLRFRDCYGEDTLQAKVFDSREYTEFNSLVLRSGGQDRLRTIMKDELTTSLADGILDVQAYRPVILYINGEYWGMYYVREKISDDYIASRYKVSPESVDLLQGNGTINAGSNTAYKELIQYVKTHDLRQADVYQYVCDRVDVQNYADYIISEIYCGNQDSGNIRFFRSSEGDGKWRWIFFDTDLGFQFSDELGIWHIIDPAGTGHNNAFSTALISNLLKNDQFRALFLERWEYHMKNTYSTQRVLARIDELYTIWKNEAPRNFQRWNPNINWEANVESLRNFAKGRQATLKKEMATAQIQAIFKMSGEQIDKLFE